MACDRFIHYKQYFCHPLSKHHLYNGVTYHIRTVWRESLVGGNFCKFVNDHKLAKKFKQIHDLEAQLANYTHIAI